MGGALDAPKLLWRIGEREQFLAEADGQKKILGPVQDQRGRRDRADQQVVVERITKQRANRDEPVGGRRDVGDRRIGRVKQKRPNLVLSSERDSNACSTRVS